MESVRLLSTRDVQRILGVSRATLDKMRVRGVGPPFIRVGSLIKYNNQLLQDWIEENTRRGEIDGRFASRTSER